MFESATDVALNAKPYAPSEEFADASSEALLVNRIDKDDAMDLMHESVKKFTHFSFVRSNRRHNQFIRIPTKLKTD